jgi:hypothetical protein
VKKTILNFNFYSESELFESELFESELSELSESELSELSESELSESELSESELEFELESFSELDSILDFGDSLDK